MSGLWVAPAHGQAVPARPAGAEDRPAIAEFEGRRINLARGWDGAEACLVWRQGGVLECFRTSGALDARAQQLSAQRGQPAPPDVGGETLAAAAYSCSSSLDLYEHNWYGGRRLSFWDRGYWQNLGDYGFNDRLSSYVTGGCSVYLAEHSWGGGWWYPGYTGPYHGEAYMWSGWEDRMSSIYIA